MGQKRTDDAASVDAHVGLRLRQLRQARGLSLQEMARIMGHASGQAVSKYEHGGAFPAALMFRTAEGLGVGVGCFFEGLGGTTAGVAETAEPFLLEALGDSTEARKIAALLRAAPARQHAMILRVVRALVASAPSEGEG